MKNIFTSLIVFMAGMSIANAQVHGFGCTAGEESQKQYDKHPELLVAKAQLDAFTKQYVQQHRQTSQRVVNDSTIVIPVVFHIEHDAGPENIPDSKVYTEMLHWNEYVQQRNADLSTTDSTFVPLIGNLNVEFRLAQIDPNGHPTNGIERIYTQSTYLGNNNTKLDPWPREKYLNVWSVRGLDRDIDSMFGTLAYSMYPSSVATYVNNDIIDGIITKHSQIGANDQFSRPTMAHESGHWMNLEHVWGNTNSPGVDCGDDDVDDTPITWGNSGGCPHYYIHCNPTRLDTVRRDTIPMVVDTIPAIIENEQNIMNYAQCHFMFTKGQVARAQAALHSPIAGRNNIWTDSNKIATGVMDSLTYPNPNSTAIPVADFAVNSRYTCTNTTVKFTDVSWNAPITTRTWTFPPNVTMVGTSTTSDVSPQVQFVDAGWQVVTLEVGNANGSNSKTKTMVYVTPDGVAITAPYFEGFEDPNSVNNWQVQNYDNNNTFFQRYTGAGHYSNNSFKLNMYNAGYDGDRDDLVSPVFDLSSVDPSQGTVSFDYSFATFDANHMNDSLATISLYATKDCGQTWTRLYYNLGGYNLYNAGTVSTGPFVPGQQDEFWQNISVNIPAAFQGNQTVSFKWSVTSAKAANHFYIDNINIGQSTTGINNVRANTIGSMNIVPNPTTGAAVLALNITSASANTTAKMYDLEGREIMTIFSGETQAGQKNISFNAENVASGIYVVKVTDGKTSIQKRFVKM